MMISRSYLIFSFALLPICTLAADGEFRGIQPGSVIGFVGAGPGYDSSSSGIHPSFGGGLAIGLTQHFGLFAESDYTMIPTPSPSTSYILGILPVCFCGGNRPDLVNIAAGLELVGSNHSHFVPYAKIGPGFGHADHGFSDYVGTSAAAIAFGGGLRVYIKKNFGIQAQALAQHYIGGSGGGTTMLPTFGVFLQSR